MILVTGATGLVGSHLLFYLAQSGYKIKALFQSKKKLEQVKKTFSYYTETPDNLFNAIEWVQGNILDTELLYEAMSDVEQIYHCAAIVSFSPKDTQNLFRVNVKGTENVINISLEKKIIKFCHMSSVAAIGRAGTGKVYTEKGKWTKSDTNSAYALSKYLAEREVQRGIAEGLKAVIVNPAIILGPGNWNQSSSRLFKKVWDGLKYYTGGSNGFVDVRDVAIIMIKLMESNIENERFILATENMSYKSFFTEIATNLNKPVNLIKATRWMSEVVWRTDWLKSKITGNDPVITKETAHTANQRNEYSNEKIVTALDYKFIPVYKSINDTCNLFLKENSI